jgi:hypothetical protein
MMATSDCFMPSGGINIFQHSEMKSSATRRFCRRLSIKASERNDGATDEQVKQAYTTYEELMRTNNFGKGYWMDSPLQFFTNIQQAISRNFGSGSKSANPLDVFNPQPKVVDLRDSPFRPLMDMDDQSEQETPVTKTALPAQPVGLTESAPKPKAKTLKKTAKSAPASPKSETAQAGSLDVSHLYSKLSVLA